MRYDLLSRMLSIREVIATMKATNPIPASNAGPIFCDVVVVITWVMVLATSVASFGIGLFPAVFAGIGITLGALGVKYLAQIRNAAAIRYNHEILRMPLERTKPEDQAPERPRNHQREGHVDRRDYEPNVDRRPRRRDPDF